MRSVFPSNLLLRIGCFITDEALHTSPNKWGLNGESVAIRTMLHHAITPNPTVIDVGANEGQWLASLLSELVDFPKVAEVSIHAFEPLPEARSRLYEFLASRPREHDIRVSDFGMSATPASNVRFLTRGFSAVSSLYEADGYDDEILVRLTTLDMYAKQHGLEQIDFVKIDTEGHDFRVIEGAASLLEVGAVRFLQFEYNWRWIDARTYLKDVFDFVEHVPYELVKVSPNGLVRIPEWWPDLETYRDANYLLVHQEILPNIEFEAVLYRR